MNSIGRSQLEQILRQRADSLIVNWHATLAQDRVPSSRDRSCARQSAKEWSRKMIGLVTAETLDEEAAEALGIRLARYHHPHSEALGQTLTLLCTLSRELAAEWRPLLRPRLANLAGAIASGYLAEVNRALESANETLRQEAVSRKRIAEALEESDRRYRLIADNAQDVIWTTNMDLNITYVTPSIERVRGFTVEEAMNQRPDEVFTPTSLKAIQEMLAEELALEASGTAPPHRSRTVELELFCKDGSTVWSEIRLTFLRDADGTPIGILGVGRDITHQREAKQALRRRNQELALLNRVGRAVNSTLELDEVLTIVLREVRTLLDVAAASVWLVDKDTNEVVCEQATGPGKDVVLGWRLPPGVGVAGWVVRHGESVVITDTHNDERYFYKVEQEIDLELRSMLSTPLVRGTRYIGTLQVVDTAVDRFGDTDIQLLESLAATAAVAIENARLYRQARRDAETRKVLLKEVNHRVKNNLAAIIGLLYTERRHRVAEDQFACKATINMMINRLQGLSTVHSLLAASEWSPIQMSDLVGHVMKTSVQTLPKGKHLYFDISPSPVQVTAEQAHSLALIVNELVTNTIKHTLVDRDTAQVAARIDRKDGAINLVYCDDGPGYPENVLVMEEYSVGLDLVGNIVRRSLGGDLTFRNDPGATTIIEFKAKV